MSSWKAKILKDGNYSSYLNGKFHEFQGYEKCLEELAYTIQQTLNYAEQMEEKNAELEDHHWKDSKLQELKNKYEKMESDYYRGFPISEKQDKAICEWKEQHYTNIHNAPDTRSRIAMSGVSGGSFSYKFVPTSIGTYGICQCNSCCERMLKELGHQEDYKNFGEYYDKKKELIKKYDCEFEFQEI